MRFEFYMPNGYATNDLMNLSRVYIKMGTVRRWLRPLLRGLMILCGAVLVLGGAILLFSGAAEEGLGSAIVIFLVIGCLWLLIGLFAHRLNAWGSRRLMIKGLESITVTLDETGVAETTNKGTALHPYKAFVDVVCYRNTYFLFLDKRHAIILPVQTMTQGSPAIFDGCWLQMGGKPIRHFS